MARAVGGRVSAEAKRDMVAGQGDVNIVTVCRLAITALETNKQKVLRG